MTVRRSICPGSFDPVTNGHLDVIVRASRLYDEVVVGGPGQPDEDRPVHGRGTHRDAPGGDGRPAPTCGSTRSTACSSTTAASGDIPVIVKGLRAVSDFDYELQMAQMNHGLAGVETLFVRDQPGLLLPVL